MPYAPRRGCAYQGCSKRAVAGSTFCEEHKKQIDKQYNKHERTVEMKKYGRAWKRIRDRYIREHPLCERCLEEGRVTIAEEVHHILPLSRGGTSSPDNLMSLCRSCHNKIHHDLGDR
jgi:5-methylcytosine-specific restriction protein A